MKKIHYNYGKDVPLDFFKAEREHGTLAMSFKCKNDYIDKFVKKTACKDKESVTYLTIDTKENVIVAILTVVCSGIYTEPSILSRRERTVIPAIEIKYFAVDNRYQSLRFDADSDITLSKYIFSKYMKDIENIAHNIIGARKIILYSVPKAVNFYRYFGFKDFEKYMKKDEQRSVRKCPPMFISLNQ